MGKSGKQAQKVGENTETIVHHFSYNRLVFCGIIIAIFLAILLATSPEISPKTSPATLFGANIFNSKRGTGFAETEYVLEGKTRRVLVADTPEKWERGLMHYRKNGAGATAQNSRKLPEGIEGMLFVSSGKVFRAFWNKNTFLNLDLYWVSGDRVVGKNFLPSIEKSKDIVTVSSPEAVDKVVEIVNDGY